MTDLFEEIHGVSLATSSAETFFTGWLKRKEAENAEATAAAYRGAVQGFLVHLGPRAKLDVNHVTADDVLGFRDGLIGKVSASTISNRLKIVRIAFNAASQAGLMQSNPAVRVEKLHEKPEQGDEPKQALRPLTIDEIQKIFDLAPVQRIRRSAGMLAGWFGWFARAAGERKPRAPWSRPRLVEDCGGRSRAGALRPGTRGKDVVAAGFGLHGRPAAPRPSVLVAVAQARRRPCERGDADARAQKKRARCPGCCFQRATLAGAHLPSGAAHRLPPRAGLARPRDGLGA